MISLILEKKLPTKKITWHFFMLNVRKKYFCLFQELFNVNLSSNFCVKYINNFQDIVKFVQFSFLKKWENENDLDLFLNGPNFMRNGIIISVLFIKAIFYELPKRRCIFQPTKYEHKDVRESIDSDDTNLSSTGFAE